MRRQPEEKISPVLRGNEIFLHDFHCFLKIFPRGWTVRKTPPHPAFTPRDRPVGSVHLLPKDHRIFPSLPWRLLQWTPGWGRVQPSDPKCLLDLSPKATASGLKFFPLAHFWAPRPTGWSLVTLPARSKLSLPPSLCLVFVTKTMDLSRPLTQQK